MAVLRVRGPNKFENRSRCPEKNIPHRSVDKKVTRYTDVRVDSLFLMDFCTMINVEYTQIN